MSDVRLIDLSCSERLTLWVIRRFARERSSRCAGQMCLMKGIFWPCFGEDFDGVAEVLAEAFARHAGSHNAPIAVGEAGAQVLTAVEVSLLAATACIQTGEDEMARACLAAAFDGRGGVFLSAVTLLATRLACAGHWLPAEHGALGESPCFGAEQERWTDRADGPEQIIGAAALGTVRRQAGPPLARSYVMWPRSRGFPSYS
ncbi:hypothetical protein [Acidomonas methanolica]|uniref:hypothetical protein n=1 Tax=Acidomonas methanolica TaxID=437 RepID=UPI002119C9AE|nr:hypothetical protein [Acidomonas methanolica]MCQ9156451.1 hypothetical protein [Acidomonas methanolica]